MSKRSKKPKGDAGAGALILEITRKSPRRIIKRPGTIQDLIYQSLKTLKRAEESKIVDVVMAHKDFKSKQDEPAAQIRWYLWKFKDVGLVRQIPDRRWKVRTNTG